MDRNEAVDLILSTYPKKVRKKVEWKARKRIWGAQHHTFAAIYRCITETVEESMFGIEQNLNLDNPIRPDSTMTFKDLLAENPKVTVEEKPEGPTLEEAVQAMEGKVSAQHQALAEALLSNANRNQRLQNRGEIKVERAQARLQHILNGFKYNGSAHVPPKLTKVLKISEADIIAATEKYQEDAFTLKGINEQERMEILGAYQYFGGILDDADNELPYSRRAIEEVWRTHHIPIHRGEYPRIKGRRIISMYRIDQMKAQFREGKAGAMDLQQHFRRTAIFYFFEWAKPTEVVIEGKEFHLKFKKLSIPAGMNSAPSNDMYKHIK